MYTTYGDDFQELFSGEDTEDTEDTESWFGEAGRFGGGRGGRGGGRSGPVSTAKKGNPVPQKVADGYATKADLQATAQRLDGRIATNSKAITTLDGRTRALETETGRIGTALKKEIADRTAVTQALQRGLDESRQIAMLLPLLSTTDTVTIGTQANVMIDTGDKFTKLLPILLLSGGFGGFGSGTSAAPGQSSGGLFGGDGGIGTLAIVMALTK
jgi:hypothetical protein